MKVIGVSITLCTILTLSRATPFNYTLQTGSCESANQKCNHSWIGAFCPQCDTNGTYLPKQCSGSTGYCWCVNVTDGTMLPHTMTPPGHQLNCGLCKTERQNCPKPMPGSFCPRCDSNGNFLPQQCNGSTGYCWCVDVISGKTLPNTTTPPTQQLICGLCKTERQTCPKPMPGSFCPRCDSNGNFLPQQCNGSTGYCWCVDVTNGTMLPNTTTPPGHQLNCGNASESHHEENQSEEADSECEDCNEESDGTEEHQHPKEPESECDDCSNGSKSSEEEDESKEPDPECDGCSSEAGESHHDCPHGWSRFRDHCYIFIGTPKTWVDAEVYCQFDGANLASVHSDHGNRFIMSLTRGNTHDFPQSWLGGFDAIHPGYWMWSDGSDFDYNNWAENVHDDGDNDKKSCLRMNYEYDLKWFPTSCRDPLPFVCAKSVSAPPEPPRTHE